MTTQEWLAYAEEHKARLKTLLEHYHPVNLKNPWLPGNTLHRITAPNAERACANVRTQIAIEEAGRNPLQELEDAIADKQVGKIYALLNSAWFGVPESASCWAITGFKEAVTLLEEIPEAEDENQTVHSDSSN